MQGWEEPSRITEDRPLVCHAPSTLRADGNYNLAILQGVALARFGRALDWGTVAAWSYAGVFAAVGVIGAWGLLASRRAQAPPS